MRSAFTNAGQSASSGRNSRAKVVLPAPFGPARMMMRFRVGDTGRLAFHDSVSMLATLNGCAHRHNLHSAGGWSSIMIVGLGRNDTRHGVVTESSEAYELSDVVETALAKALVLAAEAKRWDVVMQIAGELRRRGSVQPTSFAPSERLKRSSKV